MKVPPPLFSSTHPSSYQSPVYNGPLVLPCLESLDLPFADDSAAVTPTSEDISAFHMQRSVYQPNKNLVRSSMTLVSGGSAGGLYQPHHFYQQNINAINNRIVQLESR